MSINYPILHYKILNLYNNNTNYNTKTENKNLDDHIIAIKKKKQLQPQNKIY